MPPKFEQQQYQVEEQQAEKDPHDSPTTTEDAAGEAAAQQAQQQAIADEKRFTQAELDKAIQERLQRERQKAKDEQEKASAEAEKKRLQEESKFKELSEKQAGDLLTLSAEKETLAAQMAEREEKLRQYEEVFAKQLAEQKKALPEPVQKLLSQMPLLEQSAWMAENGPKLGVTAKGVPPTPKGSSGNNSQDEEAARQAGARRYNNF